MQAPEAGPWDSSSSGRRNQAVPCGRRTDAALLHHRLRRLALSTIVMGPPILCAAGVALSQDATLSPDARIGAPIGHRQPRPSDLPPNVQRDDELDQQSAPTPPQKQGRNRRSPALPARAGSVPTINVRPSCEAAAGGIIGLKQDINTCLQEEQSTREQIVKEWNQFRADDRASCTRLATMSGGGTYTELITCLEMLRDARNLPRETTNLQPVRR